MASVGNCKITNPFRSIYHIETPGNVFVTLLVGEKKALLVDTGLGMCDLAAVVRGITPLPFQVINTHGHIDHIAGNYQFPRVLLNFADLECAKKATSLEGKEKILQLHQTKQVDLNAYRSYALDNIQPLDVDMCFHLGGLTVYVISMPTHTPGSIGFYIPERMLILSGDAIAPFICLFFPEASSRSAHLALLRQIQSVPFQYLLCSHCERPIPKQELRLYVDCAANYDEAKTVRYHDSYFPHFTGRLFSYSESVEPDTYAFLICKQGET